MSLPGGGHKKRNDWAGLGPLEKRAAAEAWSVHYSPPPHIALVLDSVFSVSGSASANLIGQTVLLTWIGPWGLKNSKGDWMSLPPSVTMESLVERLRKDAQVKKLWQVMQDGVEALRLRIGAADAS